MSDTNDLNRKSKSLSAIGTTILESVGLLNKGSAGIATGAITTEVVEQKLPVTPPALNVTRVSGLAALIASVGAASLALFNIDKSKDGAAIVSAAYGSVGLIVAASLISVAVILSADIRARSGLAAASASPAKPKESEAEPSSAQSIRAAWDAALKRLETASDGLAQATGNSLSYSKLWLDACGAGGLVAGLDPRSPLLDEQSRLTAAHTRVSELLEKLIDDRSKEGPMVLEIEALVRDMRETVNNIAV